MNKYIVTLTLSLACASSFAATKYNFPMAINYDPGNSNAEFAGCQVSNNVACMKRVVENELRVIKANGFSTIKTFYSSYSTHAGVSFPIADLAKKAGLKVMLGIYEFEYHPDDPAWTAGLVQAAIAQAKSHPDTVVGIVVGNEDIFDSNGNLRFDRKKNPNDAKEPEVARVTRIEQDMKTIKSGINNTKIAVLTAQRKDDWYRILEGKCGAKYDKACKNVIELSDVIGSNDYPIWGGSPEKCTVVSDICKKEEINESVAQTIPLNAKKLEEKIVATLGENNRKQVIITEEGWASAKSKGQNNVHVADIDSLVDYYTYWKKLQTKPGHDVQSVYFQFYDKREVKGYAEGADIHFGLCNSNQTVKDARLTSVCK